MRAQHNPHVMCTIFFYFTAAQAPSTLRRFHKSPVLYPAKQNIFVHTGILLSFSLVHTKPLESDENDWDLGLHLCRTGHQKVSVFKGKRISIDGASGDQRY